MCVSALEVDGLMAISFGPKDDDKNKDKDKDGYTDKNPVRNEPIVNYNIKQPAKKTSHAGAIVGLIIFIIVISLGVW